jgi:mono/diheme cytochrome c family protein
MKKALVLAAFTLSASGWAQTVEEVVKQGEQVFAESCATGYCHGVKGAAAGAPRLAGRQFDQPYIGNIAANGVPGTAMPAFAKKLSRPDLVAVIAYVARLNGIENPKIGREGAEANASSRPQLTGEAARGARLFSEAVRGFGRCSTCHEVGDVGISVAAPINEVPASAAELKALATPDVKTGIMDGESLPVLVLSQGKGGTLFYDLTSAPPVQRNAEPGSVKFTDHSPWRHSSVIKAYDDSELDAILAYLHAVIKP